MRRIGDANSPVHCRTLFKMSDSIEQLSSKRLFDAAVRSFERKLSARFQALMPYKDGVADLRAKNASFRTIAQLLKQAGVNVSHDTVARFCHAVIEQTQPRQKNRLKSGRTATEEERPLPQNPLAGDAKHNHSVIAVLQERRSADATTVASGKSRGPRIADPKNV
jgi:N-methylhydantoinase B/oxoprolinase/acetone carboxylase alpha subunit